MPIPRPRPRQKITGPLPGPEPGKIFVLRPKPEEKNQSPGQETADMEYSTILTIQNCVKKVGSCVKKKLGDTRNCFFKP